MPLNKPIVDEVIEQAFRNGVTDFLADVAAAQLTLTPPFQIFHVNLPELAGDVGVANATLVSWRFLATGGRGVALIGEVPLSTANQGWLMTGLWQGPHVAETHQEYLNLDGLEEVQIQDYDLQIMSIPGLLIEAFWLKSRGPGPDLVIPFVTRSKQLEHFQRYTMDEFLGIVRPLAQKRILFDDNDDGAGS